MTHLVMTLAESLHISEAVYSVYSKISKVFENLERSKNIKNTIRELNQLTDRELYDIGISRGMIRSVAMETNDGVSRW